MPLIKSKSDKAVGKNIKTEEKAGKPHKQAIAIALDVQRRAKAKKEPKKMAEGGEVKGVHKELGEEYPVFRHTKKGTSLAGLAAKGSPKSRVSKDEHHRVLGEMREMERKHPASKKNFAEGGLAEETPEQKMRKRLNSFLGPAQPQNLAKGGEVKKDHEEHYASIADAILKKKRAAESEGEEELEEPSQMDMEEPAGEEFHEMNELAAEDHMEHEDEEEHHDRVAKMMKARKARK